jgi:hypothetical protein
MQTAIGHLRYEPQVPGLAANGPWAILACDADWHRMCARDVERRTPGQWMHVADADRVFDVAYQGRPQRPLIRKFKKGGEFTEHQIQKPHEVPTVFVDYTPHLGLVRPRFDPPAGGPHISIVRNEQPTRNRHAWEFQARLGAAIQNLTHLRSAKAQMTAKAEAFALTIREVASAKERQNMEHSLAAMWSEVMTLTRRITQAENAVDRLNAERLRSQEIRRMPDFLVEDALVEFEYDPELLLGRTHWFLRVRCPQVVEFRRFYGLPDYPRVPLHLTVGVLTE